MHSTPRTTQRISNRSSVMLALADSGLMSRIHEALGNFGELILRSCPSPVHIVEAMPRQKPDAFIVEFSQAEHGAAIEELFSRAVGRPIIVLAARGCEFQSDDDDLIVLDSETPVEDIRRVLLSAIVATKWKAA